MRIPITIITVGSSINHQPIIGGPINGDTPNGWFRMENPKNITPISGNLHIADGELPRFSRLAEGRVAFSAVCRAAQRWHSLCATRRRERCGEWSSKNSTRNLGSWENDRSWTRYLIMVELLRTIMSSVIHKIQYESIWCNNIALMSIWLSPNTIDEHL